MSKVIEYEPNISDLNTKFADCRSRYSMTFARINLLDAVDRGDLWKAMNVKYPSYQVLPDTNFVTYVKNNILASVYTVAKSAQIQPTSKEDQTIVTQLNVALEYIWDTANVGYFQFQAGERAALTNVGITQVGWSENVIHGSGSRVEKGAVSFKNIDPTKFMRDPYAVDLESSEYCLTYEKFHKSIFLSTPAYTEEFKRYLATHKSGNLLALPDNKSDRADPNASADYYNLVIFWVRDGAKIHEIHTVDASHILLIKRDIQPAIFPFAILNCNLPAGDLVGRSEPAKIFTNNVVYNVLDSIAMTAEYKNQRPPRFISDTSNLNVQSFMKHGNEADYTFAVTGPANQAVHYHEFPQTSPNLPMLKNGLQMGMQTVSGVDPKYTGRDTGSILTTGGVEEMLGRATLIDLPKILNYEMYTKRLTELVLSNLLEHSPSRSYFRKKPNTNDWETVEVDFPKIDAKTLFRYAIDISSELPKNKTRIAQMSTMLLEKQMQYGGQGGVEWITPEEWLMFQDLPYKEYMLDRMGIQRLSDATEDVATTLFEYANLVKNGMDPNEAINMTAKTMEQKRTGQPLEPQTMLPPSGIPAQVDQGLMNQNIQL